LENPRRALPRFSAADHARDDPVQSAQDLPADQRSPVPDRDGDAGARHRAPGPLGNNRHGAPLGAGGVGGRIAGRNDRAPAHAPTAVRQLTRQRTHDGRSSTARWLMRAAVSVIGVVILVAVIPMRAVVDALARIPVSTWLIC